MRTHLFNMVLYAVVIPLLLSIIMRDDRRERVHFTAKVAAILVAGAIGVAWLMALAP